MISKMILSSGELECSEEIITIAAVLSVQVNLFNFFAVTECLNFFSFSNLPVEVLDSEY